MPGSAQLDCCADSDCPLCLPACPACVPECPSLPPTHTPTLAPSLLRVAWQVFNELPLEFAAEVNQLMSLKLEGSVG